MQGARQRPSREARASSSAAAPAHERNVQTSEARSSEPRAEERAAVTGHASSAAASPPVSEAAFGAQVQGMNLGANGVPTSSPETALDLDVTVLAFAQWVTEMKSRQHNSSHQMQAEMSIIRNAITSNNTELSDFKRHSAAIQQQMQSEIIEIRESLSSVFMEITNAVRNNAAADQDIKLKIQSLNEQAVRNETAFAQLADAADQSQSKLRNAVQEMQHSSERMRDELTVLNRHTESLETTLVERTDNIGADVEQLATDLKSQLDRRKDHLKKMVNDVCGISNSVTSWMSDFTEQKKSTTEMQNKLQSSLYVLDQSQRREASGPREDGAGVRRAPAANMADAASRSAAQMPTAAMAGRISPMPQRPTATVSTMQVAPMQMTAAAGRPIAVGPTMVYR
mmetsp:Transcript_79165/g.220069  ORF Transcript_79165/g.220069 Transcript_79165/m.220069 type:complete len:397 (+) Transcript_79165:138-1328(+)